MSNKNTVLLKTGQYMPLIGLGTWTGSGDVMRKSLRIALDYGYRCIDTAYLYMNEDVIGDELQDWFARGKLRRENIFVTSKLPVFGNRPEDVNKFLTKSLNKLKLDYLDLYLIHHPFGFKCMDDEETIARAPNGDVYIYDTNLEEIWKAMEKEVEAGRIKALGLSNFNSQQIERILKIAKYPPAVLQVEVHAYFQQRPLVEFCQKRGIVVVAYRPLGSRLPSEESSSPGLLENPTVLEIATKHGRNAGQILLKYLLQRNIAVIPKSASPERIKANFDIMDFTLTKEDMDALAKLDNPEKRLLNFKDGYPGCENHKEYPFHIEF